MFAPQVSAMTDHFINLNCANCGAKVDVYDDLDRFACGYCGTESMVQRRGTVALKAVTEAVKKVQIGTDKTAAELALVRLEKELRALKAEEQRFLSKLDTKTGQLTLFVAVVAVFGIVPAHSMGGGAGVVFGTLVITCGLAGIWSIVNRNPPKEVTDVQAKLRHIQQRMAELRTVVDS